VTRKNPYEKNTDEPLGDQISLEDAIRAMTLGGAYSMRKENEFGSIEKGKSADMVVLDRNLFEIDHSRSLTRRSCTRSSAAGSSMTGGAATGPEGVLNSARIQRLR